MRHFTHKTLTCKCRCLPYNHLHLVSTLDLRHFFTFIGQSNAGVINTNITWSLQKLFFDINIWQCFLAILLCQPMQFHTNDTRLSTQYINLVIFLQSCATWKGEDCFHLCFREMEIPKFHINNFSQYFELITKVICACKNGGCMIYSIYRLFSATQTWEIFSVLACFHEL